MNKIHELYYQTFAQNKEISQVVILLHGLFGQSDNLAGLAKSLADKYRVIVPDLVNHGRSFHRQQMDYPAMANDVIQLMDALEIKKADIFGHSMGGKVAMQMAISFPLRVNSLIVADIAPVKYSASHLEIIRLMKQVATQDISTRKQADAILATGIADAGLRQFFLKSLKRNENGRWSWYYGLDEISNAYECILDKPVLLAPYNQRVLFIKGSNSDYIKNEYADDTQQYFPHASLKIIHNTGHWLHVEKPEMFNRIVRSFLQQQ